MLPVCGGEIVEGEQARAILGQALGGRGVFCPVPGEEVLEGALGNSVDTLKRRMPSDLATLPFDDPTVISRYENLLTWVFSQIPNVQLTSLTIGNEVDVYLDNHPSEWPHYRNFFQQVSAYARTLRPGLKVEVKGTFSSMTGSAESNMQALNQYSDVVEVTYYPLNADFTPK